MAGSLRVGMVVLALIAGAGSADAFGGGGGRAAYSCSFYPAYPAPTYGPAYYVPWGAPCEALPPAYPPSPPMARPSKERPAKERPAKERSQPLVKPIPKDAKKDAKKTSEPPVDARRAPIVTESRSLGGVFAEPAPTMPQGMARVGFWNVTGRDVTLSIDGRQRALPKDRAITVNLERSFTWQVNDGALQTERVPVDQRSFEVIIRP